MDAQASIDSSTGVQSVTGNTVEDVGSREGVEPEEDREVGVGQLCRQRLGVPGRPEEDGDAARQHGLRQAGAGRGVPRQQQAEHRPPHLLLHHRVRDHLRTLQCLRMTIQVAYGLAQCSVYTSGLRPVTADWNPCATCMRVKSAFT